MQQIELYLTTHLGRAHHSGDRYLMATCPFHDDRTPSLSVTSDTGAFRCFSCGARGDLAALIAKVEDMSPREAIAKAGRLRAGGRHD